MSQNANNIIDRLKEELLIKTDKDLCQIIAIKPNTLSTWKKRDTLDFNKVISLCEERNLDLNYIFFDEREIVDNKEVIVNDEVGAPKIIIEPVSPTIEELARFQLVNTNRNIALFDSFNSYHPRFKNRQMVLGQKSSKKLLKPDEVYIIKCEDSSVFLDEVVMVGEEPFQVQLKSYFTSDDTYKIVTVQSIWTVIGAITIP